VWHRLLSKNHAERYLIAAFGLHSIGRHRYLHDELNECVALVQEKVVSYEGLDGSYGASILGQGRPDDRNRREIRTEEFRLSAGICKRL
jgi:hypothetical protein